ncbi:hypothetical protein [Catenovulum sediminis]|uniref:hypothetical protein n=1 Tax=Catenovulum sediminis TaxID=1740262 RepID=UPI00117DF018|nr:hypothetical protein [Catenovulum sediminis]
MKPKLYLAIKGFDKHKVSANCIGALLKSIPVGHILGLQSIVFSSAEEFNRLGVSVPLSCQAAYYPAYRSVVIHQNSNIDKLTHVLFHEIGHYVFYSRLSSYSRKEWVSFFGKNNTHVSDYARTNASEDFAECYAFYAKQDWSKFAGVYNKLTFMKSHVFNSSFY